MTENEFDWSDWPYSPDKLPGDWQHVITIDSGGGYEWATLHAFHSPSSRRFYWHGDSGCSCNMWGERVDDGGGLQDGSRDDLERAIRAFADEHDYYFKGPYVIDMVDKLRKWRADA